MRKLKVTELNRLSAAAYRESAKLPLVVVLDDVRSLHNVGAVFRTSDAFRIKAIYICGITACPPHAEIRKTALGAEDIVDWTYFRHIGEAIGELREEGYTICAVEQADGSTMLNCLEIDRARRYAVVFGNEVNGVCREVVEECDVCIEIPQRGTKHSLNVSVSAGIVLWDLFRKMSD
jgi:tRNA G18 (ribose-2'-O)-methylase SpoU